MNNNRELEKKTLSQIIEDDGRCENVQDACLHCPLKYQVKRKDGSWGSCLTAALGEGKTICCDGDTATSAVNKCFLQLAKRVLADMAIEDMLETDEQ